MNLVQFDNVRMTYHVGEVDIHALNGVSFTLDDSKVTIICGPSGAGKSTILNILGGMDRPTSGHVYLQGEDVAAYNDKQLTMYRRNEIGFVFQFYNLVPNLTALENVQLATQICKDPLDPQTVLEAVGLKERLHNFPSQLSGGEQQRVAIARALAKNPKILLCDEPTGALDYQTGKQILLLLQQSARQYGMSVVIVTHNLAITPMGDQVIRVKNGQIESSVINEHPQDVSTIEW